MLEVDEDRERVPDDRVRGPARDVRDEAEAARVVLGRRLVEGPGLWHGALRLHLVWWVGANRTKSGLQGRNRGRCRWVAVRGRAACRAAVDRSTPARRPGPARDPASAPIHARGRRASPDSVEVELLRAKRNHSGLDPAGRSPARDDDPQARRFRLGGSTARALRREHLLRAHVRALTAAGGCGRRRAGRARLLPADGDLVRAAVELDVVAVGRAVRARRPDPGQRALDLGAVERRLAGPALERQRRRHARPAARP